MNKTFADLSLGYADGILLNNQYSNSTFYCKTVGRIDEMKVVIDTNSECLAHFNIGLINLSHTSGIRLKSLGVQNGDENRNCGKEPGLYTQINGKTYNPQIGDYIIAKVNPENNYINQLYPTEGKSIDDLNKVINSINIPYCTGNIITEEKQEPPKVQLIHNTQNYYLYGIIVVLLIVIVFGVKKLYFSK